MRFKDFLNESNRKLKQLRRLSLTESDYTVQPKIKRELIQIIRDYCKENGWNSDLNFINTSLITDMSFLFCGETKYGYGLGRFNGDISKWDVSHVKTMTGMFYGAEKFNQPLNNWDVSNVRDMSYMFRDSKSFNQPLNKWDVSNVENMVNMFSAAKNFNQPLNNWDISNVNYMGYMFDDAKNFNQSLDDWDVSNVRNKEGMFKNSKLEKIGNLPNWYNE